MDQSTRRACSIPPRGHPLVRALYERMAERRVTYKQLTEASGVKASAFKAWRCTNAPGATSVQAALNAVGLQALPLPRPDILPAALASELGAIGKRHGVPLPIAELMMVAAGRTTPSD